MSVTPSRSATCTRPMPLRVASVWLALAVALLSSLMASGLPRTTSFGSAFNPATTTVALQPTRVQPRLRVEQIRRDDDLSGGQGAAIANAVPTARPIAQLVAFTPLYQPALRVDPAATAKGLDGSPRGPPLT